MPNNFLPRSAGLPGHPYPFENGSHRDFLVGMIRVTGSEANSICQFAQFAGSKTAMPRDSRKGTKKGEKRLFRAKETAISPLFKVLSLTKKRNQKTKGALG